MRNAKFIRDLAQITFCAALVLHHRRPADDFQVRDFCQVVKDFVLHPVGEERVLGIGAQVLKGEDRDALVRNRRAAGWHRVR